MSGQQWLERGIGKVVLALVTDVGGEAGMVVKTYARTDVGECLMSETAHERSPVVVVDPGQDDTSGARAPDTRRPGSSRQGPPPRAAEAPAPATLTGGCGRQPTHFRPFCPR